MACLSPDNLRSTTTMTFEIMNYINLAQMEIYYSIKSMTKNAKELQGTTVVYNKDTLTSGNTEIEELSDKIPETFKLKKKNY